MTNQDLLNSLIDEMGAVWEEIHQEEMQKAHAAFAPVRVSLFREFVINVDNSISRKGDVCRIDSMYMPRFDHSGEVAQMTVFRNGLTVRRTATARVAQLNMMIASGDISLIA